MADDRDAIVAKWDKRFRQNRAQVERALRHEAGRLREPSLSDAVEELEEITGRINRLELAKSASKPPGPIRWLWDGFLSFTSGMPWYGKLIALALVLAALGGLSWQSIAGLLRQTF